MKRLMLLLILLGITGVWEFAFSTFLPSVDAKVTAFAQYDDDDEPEPEDEEPMPEDDGEPSPEGDEDPDSESDYE